jgi:hypothetical protein
MPSQRWVPGQPAPDMTAVLDTYALVQQHALGAGCAGPSQLDRDVLPKRDSSDYRARLVSEREPECRPAARDT